ncbi:uncharacterized protein METZ01_LOCUS381798, partial [marine metagenome]
LETGATDAAVDYTSGSGNDTLVFNYTVASGNVSDDLDYKGTTSLAVGTSILDLAGNGLVTTLATPGATNSISVNKAIIIDGAVPTIDSVSTTTADGYYKEGDSLDIVLFVSEELAVTGTPRITLETGEADASVTFTSNADSQQLLFRYTIAAGHNSSDLDYTDTTSVALDGGTILDLAGNPLPLTLAVPGQAGSISPTNALVVDTQAPACSLAYFNFTQPLLSNLGKGEDRLDIKAMFNEKIKSSPTLSVFWPVATDSTHVDKGFTGSEDDDSTWTYTITALPELTTYTGNITVRL